jgi:DNA-binding transcriptional LysR family regulator
MLVRPDDGQPIGHNTSQWFALGGETLISLTKDYPHERLIHKQLARMGIGLQTRSDGQSAGHAERIGRAGLGIAVIPSFGVMASRDRKVRITQLNPLVTLEFHEISNRGRKLPAEAIEFCAFLKTYIAQRVNH